jgi:hypothetical protein
VNTLDDGRSAPVRPQAPAASPSTPWLFGDHDDDAEGPLVDADVGAPVSPRILSRPARWLLGLAALKVAVATIVLLVALPLPTSSAASISGSLVALQLIAFGGAGAVLLLAHARDVRTAHLGAVLLLVASAFATSHVAALALRVPVFLALAPLYPDAFLPVFLARFIEAFPRRPPESAGARFLRALLRTARVTGTLLFFLNALAGWGLLPNTLWVTALERRSAGDTVYWTVIFWLILATLPIALTGGQLLGADDRRRVRLFWLSFWFGFGPSVLAIVVGALPVYGPWFTGWMMRGWLAPVLELLLATVPITVAYAVLVRHLLPLRVVLRQAAQYVFARWTVTAALILPIVLLIAEGYRHRNETIATVLSGRAMTLIVVTALAGTALLARENLLGLVDRWFFREAYDPRDVLLVLGTQTRRAHRLDELVAVLTSAVDRALRPESLAVLVKNPAGDFVSLFGSVEPLLASSVLVGLLGAASEPIDVVLDKRSPLRWLPRDERQWLVDSHSRLLVPLQVSEGDLVGLVTLAERKSELPFSREDRQLLVAITEAGAVTMEHHCAHAGSAAADATPDDFWMVGATPQLAQASECAVCGHVEPGGDRHCARCGAPLRPSAVPHVMFGKFRFEERVGQGGMGIVYRATDLTLDRVVAIKTLPGTSPEDSQRLRREAKAMAAVVHRNLAIVYGAESWRGRPMLICEFMSEGTLAHRLTRGSLPCAEALSLGVALAEALHVIHATGLLHRDIKPSNIGYAADGVPKLLDFGLVHILTPTPAANPSARDVRGSSVTDAAALMTLSVTRPLIGTPLYLSPEAILGQRPTIAFDLWSLNVLLCEAMTGQHPFRQGTLRDTLDCIQAADPSRVLQRARAIPAAVAAYLERALAKDPGVRPKTALEVADHLRALGAHL